MQRIGIAMAAVWGLFLGFGIASAPARADICGDLYDECDIAIDVLSWNLDQFEGFFPLDDDTCDSMATSVLKQCESAVKSAAKCWASQIKFIPKNAKPACKTEGDFANECKADFKEDATEDVDEIDFYVESELDCCEIRASAFYTNCSFDL
jgi:hypothetical protein